MCVIDCFRLQKLSCGEIIHQALRARSCLCHYVAELADVKATLCELARLSPETRFSLLNLFQEILPDQTLLSTLESKLDKVCEEPMRDSYTYLPDTSDEFAGKFVDMLLSDTDTVSLRSNGPWETGTPT